MGTTNYNFPYIATNQASKEVTMNSALDAIDTQIHTAATTIASETTRAEAAEAALGGSSTLAADTDVTLTSPANNDVLTYETSSSKWKNKPATGGSGGGSSSLPYPDNPPVSPSVYDDEFNSSTLDPKWTLGAGGTPTPHYDINTTVPSHLYVDGQGNGSYNTFNVSQPFTPGSADFTMLLKLDVACKAAGLRMGLELSDASAHAMYMNFGIHPSSSYPMYVNVGDETQGFSNLGSTQMDVNFTGPIYLYLQRFSSTQYTIWFSTNGKAWTILIENVSKTMTITSFALEVTGPPTSAYRQVSFDFVRVNYNLNLLVNPSNSSVTTRL